MYRNGTYFAHDDPGGNISQIRCFMQIEIRREGHGENGGNCPPGGQKGPDAPGTDRSSNPQQDTQGGSASGTGQVDAKKIKEIAEVWGKLPEKERVQAMRELTRDLPPQHRELIERYFKQIAEGRNTP